MRQAYSYLAKGMLFAGIIYMASAMIISPANSIDAAESALNICAEIVIPTLFPFIFCGNMLIALGAARIAGRFFSKAMHPLFGVSGAGALAFALGIISGYPVGAVCAASLYTAGECSKTEAEKLLAFCNNSGPMFIIGAVGTGMLGNYKLGVFLYIVHILSAIICGMIFKNYQKDSAEKLLPPAREDAELKTAALDIGAAVVKSVNTILLICGFIIIFAVFTRALPDFFLRDYLYSVLEITGGLAALLKGANTEILPLISFFAAFSGISVLAQVYAVIKPFGLSIKPYVAGKLLQGIIAFGLTFFAMLISPIEDVALCQTFNPSIFQPSPENIFAYSGITIGYLIIAATIIAAICRVCKFYNK